eukprot:1611810-Pleurochrysis_carterae.AAC.1
MSGSIRFLCVSARAGHETVGLTKPNGNVYSRLKLMKIVERGRGESLNEGYCGVVVRLMICLHLLGV